MLACEFAKACTGGKCRLPSSVTSIARQGVTMTISSGMFLGGQTGIREVDAYVVSVNPNAQVMPPVVWSPDVPWAKHRYLTPTAKVAMTAVISLASLDLSCPGATVPLDPTAATDLSVYRGDSGRFQVVVTDADGTTPVDVSAATWLAEIHTVEDAPAGEFDIEPLAGQPHIVEVVLTAAVSALLVEPSYVYDVEMTLDGEVTTLIRGSVTVEADVSRP